MKQTRTFTKTALMIVVILIVAVALLPTCAGAATPTYYVSDFTDAGYTGALFYGEYFGNSRIPVSIYVYGDDIDKTDAKFVEFSSRVDSYVVSVDRCADTQALVGSPSEPTDLRRINDANSGERVEVSLLTYEMLVMAKQMYQTTDGAYNPASYRLVDLWGFSSRTYGYNGVLPYDREWQTYKKQGYESWYLPEPDQKYIDAFKTLCDFDSVLLENVGDSYFVTKTCPNVVVDGVSYSQWLDLGGVAKGYVVDGIISLLGEFGYLHYYVNAGSSSMAYSTLPDGSPFTFGFQNPFNMWQAYVSVQTSNSTLSTSGQYIRQYSMPNGTRYSHIVDCKTGRPTTSTVETVTVISSLDSGAFAGEADCWTTALTVLGKDNLKSFLTNANYGSKFEVSSVVGNKNNSFVYTNVEENKFAKKDANFDFATKVEMVDGNKVVTFDENKLSHASQKTIVVAVLSVCGVALVIFVIVKLVLSKAVSPAQRIANVRADKFFKTPDVIVYGLVVVLIVSLFAGFVFGRETDSPTTIAIECFNGQRLFVYKADTGEYVAEQVENFAVDVTQSNGKLTVTVTNTKTGDFNVVEITNDNGKATAKVVDANCGLHKECVNYFPAITTKKATIICNPHGIKVVADGAGNDYILI